MNIQKRITHKGYLETHLKLMGRDQENISKNLQNVMLDKKWFRVSLRNWRSWYRNKDSYAVTHAKDIQNLHKKYD